MEYTAFLESCKLFMITEHFTLYEFLHSAKGEKHGLKNFPDDPQIFKNAQVVASFLEVLRSLVKHPITVNSWYRSHSVNSLVGGVSNSCHVVGLAVDIAVNRHPIIYYETSIDIAKKRFEIIEPYYSVKALSYGDKGYIHIQLTKK